MPQAGQRRGGEEKNVSTCENNLSWHRRKLQNAKDFHFFQHCTSLGVEGPRGQCPVGCVLSVLGGCWPHLRSQESQRGGKRRALHPLFKTPVPVARCTRRVARHRLQPRDLEISSFHIHYGNRLLVRHALGSQGQRERLVLTRRRVWATGVVCRLVVFVGRLPIAATYLLA